MKIQTTYILAGAVVLMALASCKKDLLKTNTDPNSVSVDQFDPNNILTATQLYYTGSTDNVAIQRMGSAEVLQLVQKLPMATQTVFRAR